jgi:hypothetical protein
MASPRACASRRDFSGLHKRQAPQVFGGLGSPIARGEECPFVSLQQLDPRSDVACIPNIAVKREFGSEERGTQLRDQFLSRIGPLAEAML